MSETHFTAVVEIKKTTPKNVSGTRGVAADDRQKVDVARIVVRDTSLAKLTLKVQKHLELVEEG